MIFQPFRKAQLQRGEKILIQTRDGGTGFNALQLAKPHGGNLMRRPDSQGQA